MVSFSTRFTIGVHILALIAVAGSERCTSEFIAGSVNTNPVVIRRILALLKKAGLVKMSRGVAGTVLLRDPGSITLLDVYRAVGAADGTLFRFHGGLNPKCPVGGNIEAALGGTVVTAQKQMERTLDARTVGDIVGDIRRRMK